MHKNIILARRLLTVARRLLAITQQTQGSEIHQSVIIGGLNTVKNLIRDFPDRKEDILRLAERDPSGKQYTFLDFMWKQVRDAEKTKREIDVDEMVSLLKKFIEIKKIDDSRDKKDRKIQFNANTLDDLRKILINSPEDYLSLYEAREKHKALKEANKDKPPKVLYDKDDIRVLEFFTKDQVLDFGDKCTNTWCITKRGTNYYDKFDKPGSRFLGIELPDDQYRIVYILNNKIIQLRDPPQNEGQEKDVPFWDLSRKVMEDLGFAANFDADGYAYVEKQKRASDPKTPPATLVSYAKDPDFFIRKRVVNNPSCPETALNILAEDTNLAWTAFNHDNFSLSRLKQIANDVNTDSRIRKLAVNVLDKKTGYDDDALLRELGF